MSRALTYAPRPHLKEIYLRDITLTERVLLSLFRQSEKPLRIVVLYGIYLAAGTWAGVMDGLRQVECASKFIKFPWGAEFTYGRLSDYTDHGPEPLDSLVGAYINGIGKTNPMRILRLSYAEYREMETKTQKYYAGEASDDQEYWAHFEPAQG